MAIQLLPLIFDRLPVLDVHQETTHLQVACNSFLPEKHKIQKLITRSYEFICAQFKSLCGISQNWHPAKRNLVNSWWWFFMNIHTKKRLIIQRKPIWRCTLITERTSCLKSHYARNNFNISGLFRFDFENEISGGQSMTKPTFLHWHLFTD